MQQDVNHHDLASFLLPPLSLSSLSLSLPTSRHLSPFDRVDFSQAIFEAGRNDVSFLEGSDDRWEINRWKHAFIQRFTFRGNINWIKHRSEFLRRD